MSIYMWHASGVNFVAQWLLRELAFTFEMLCGESTDQRIGMLIAPFFPRFPDLISIDYGEIGASLFSVAVISETYQRPRSVTA